MKSSLDGFAESPAVQLRARPGMIELGFGQPDPALLPSRAIKIAADGLLGGAQAADALSYGYERGPRDLVDAIADRIAETERRPSSSELLVTGGNSQALDELLTHLASPGDSILVEAPTYNFALAIMRSHCLRPVGVPNDEEGMQIERLEEAFGKLCKENRAPSLLYVIPTFHNPTGASLSRSRRHELVSFASARGLTIIEDDAYRELSYRDPAPESLWSIDPDRVVRLGTVSKSLAPGLRVGWMTANERLTRTLELAGLRQSGGGVNHFAAMVVAKVIRSGLYAATVDQLRAEYKARRNALVAGLAATLDGTSYQVPLGGYFVWLELPSTVDASMLLSQAEAEGVSFVPGRSFFPSPTGNTNYLRLAFTYYEPTMLKDGAERLVRIIRNLHPTRRTS
jgi:2-aminoadipate transaminase